MHNFQQTRFLINSITILFFVTIRLRVLEKYSLFFIVINVEQDFTNISNELAFAIMIFNPVIVRVSYDWAQEN